MTGVSPKSLKTGYSRNCSISSQNVGEGQNLAND